jgi:hypothetical protein
VWTPLLGARAVHRFLDVTPRFLTKDEMCDYLGAISGSTYDKWHARGMVPGPVPGTNRYDIRQHDEVLDRILGISSAARKLSPLEQWELAHQ